MAYSAMAVGGYAAAAALLVGTSHGFLDVAGQPIGTDFASFWTAGSLALQGHASAAYDWTLHAAAQTALFGRETPYYAWSYPPLFLLCMAPLALLPYGWALLTWLAATAAAYVGSIGRILPHPRTWLVALALPAVFVNLGHGQNGFLSAALFASGLLLLDSRPLAAGILFGTLCYKPQLVLLVPFALVAGRHWRALSAMTLTALVLCAATVAAFGTEVWQAFGSSIAQTQGRILEQGAVSLWKMVSVFAAVRVLGGGIGTAWAVQWLVSIVVVGAIVWAWRSRGPIHLKSALLVAGVPLATPFALDYDLVVLAIPVAWLTRDGLQGGFLPWERSAIFAACILPALARPLALLAGIPLAPLVELALAAAAARRLWFIESKAG